MRRCIVRLKPILSLCLVVCLSFSAWAQSQAGDPALATNSGPLESVQSARAKNEVQKRGAGERVRVTLRDKTEVKGYISQINAESFQVTDKKSGRVTTVAYHDVLKVRKQGMSTAAKIAIGAAIGAGSLMAVGFIALAASGE